MPLQLASPVPAPVPARPHQLSPNFGCCNTPQAKKRGRPPKNAAAAAAPAPAAQPAIPRRLLLSHLLLSLLLRSEDVHLKTPLQLSLLLSLLLCRLRLQFLVTQPYPHPLVLLPRRGAVLRRHRSKQPLPQQLLPSLALQLQLRTLLLLTNTTTLQADPACLWLLSHLVPHTCPRPLVRLLPRSAVDRRRMPTLQSPRLLMFQPHTFRRPCQRQRQWHLPHPLPLRPRSEADRRRTQLPVSVKLSLHL